MRRLGCALVAALLLVALLQSVAVGATRQPVVGAVRVPATVQVRQPFVAKVVVVNRVRHRSGRVTMKVVLSRDAQRDRRDARVATLEVPALKAGARRVFRVRVRPKRTGKQWLIACIRKRCNSAVVRVKAPPPVLGQDPAEPPPVGNPLDVSPVLDSARAASAVIRADSGGTITATGANGSTYVLVVPADGVLSDERITLTPVTDLGGRPFTGGASAVDITPHGLQLGRLASLTITPPAAIPLDRQFVFATRQGGKDFHAYPPTQATTGIELELSHFSIAGVGSATPAERAAAALRAPSDAQAQLEKLIGEQMQEMKRKGNVDGDALAPHLRDYWHQVVQPRLLYALDDDTLAVLAMTSYLAWVRSVQLVAAEETLAYEIARGQRLMSDVMQFAFDHGFERCMNRETGYAAALMAMARMLTIIGGPESVGDLARERLEKCARFELDLDARVEAHRQYNRSNGRPREHREVAVQAHDVALVSSFNQVGRLETTGTQPLVVTEWTYSYSGDAERHAGNAELVAPLVVQADIPLSFRLETASDGRTRYVLNRGRPLVELDPGKLELYYTIGSAGYQYPLHYTYEGGFRRLWEPERMAHRPGFYRFGAFFDESLPKLGLFLEERTLHEEFGGDVTDQFGRLRMELEHAPKR